MDDKCTTCKQLPHCLLFSESSRLPRFKIKLILLLPCSPILSRNTHFPIEFNISSNWNPYFSNQPQNEIIHYENLIPSAEHIFNGPFWYFPSSELNFFRTLSHLKQLWSYVQVWGQNSNLTWLAQSERFSRSVLHCNFNF